MDFYNIINNDEETFKDILGESVNTVYKITDKKGKCWALKVIRNLSSQIHRIRQVFILKIINNINVCKLENVFVKDNNLYLVSPIYETLKIIDNEYPDMILDNKENIKKDILSAIKYLETINISQNDIQNGNILYDLENEKYILNDFDNASFNYGGLPDESSRFDLYILELILLDKEQRKIIHDDKHKHNPIIQDFLECRRVYSEYKHDKVKKVNFYWDMKDINLNRFSRVYSIIEKNYEYITNITNCDERIIKLLLCYIFGPITEYNEDQDMSLKLMSTIFNISEEIIYSELIKLCLLLDFKLPYY